MGKHEHWRLPRKEWLVDGFAQPGWPLTGYPLRTRARKFLIPDPFPVWWATGTPIASEFARGGFWAAEVFDVKAYTGAYPKFANVILVLTAGLGSRKKTAEMSYLAEEVP